MNSTYILKDLPVVPCATDFVNIVLSSTQRKTPTVIHKSYPIVRIRQFYMRKVRYTQQTIHDRLSTILEGFPLMEDIHPFYGDLLNVLYDKDHYKLALGQLNTARHLVDNLGKDYVRLLKYGDSLYRCKQLKRAALGRMVTILKKQSASLAYLEQVRQHMSRLPAIDPNARTLLVCGYPNVGKSSFMNKVTHAKVEVESYAFTTKSLFVGHCDHKTLRWQIIDTPGILDRPLEERNTIEMQAITALAHIKCCVLFFIDISEHCGYSIDQQVALFKSIRPLFTNKPLVLVLNKIDIKRYDDLTEEQKKVIQEVVKDNPGAGETSVAHMSTKTEEGVMALKDLACDRLLLFRAQQKLQGNHIQSNLNRLHLAVPQPRDDVDRKPNIPESVLHKKTKMETEKEKKKEGDDADEEEEEEEEEEEKPQGRWPQIQQARELFAEFSLDWKDIDWREWYMLEDPDWRFDTIPLIKDGENILDWMTEDVEERFEALLKEEDERLVAYARHLEEEKDAPWNSYKPLTREELELVEKIRHKLRYFKLMKSMYHSNKVMPRKHMTGNGGLGTTTDDMKDHFNKLGIDSSKAENRVRERAKENTRSLSRRRGVSKKSTHTGGKRKRSAVREQKELDKYGDAQRDPKRVKIEAKKLKGSADMQWKLKSRKGPGDSGYFIDRPKWLLSGKRSFKADWR